MSAVDICVDVRRIGDCGIGCDPMIQVGKTDGRVRKGFENEACLDGGALAAIDEIVSGSLCSSSRNQCVSTCCILNFGGVMSRLL